MDARLMSRVAYGNVRKLLLELLRRKRTTFSNYFAKIKHFLQYFMNIMKMSLKLFMSYRDQAEVDVL